MEKRRFELTLLLLAVLLAAQPARGEDLFGRSLGGFLNGLIKGDQNSNRTNKQQLRREPARAPSAEDALTKEQRERIQIELTRRGFDVGNADGVFGATTRQGIKHYQAKNGTPPTGRLDADQIAELLSPPPATTAGKLTDGFILLSGVDLPGNDYRQQERTTLAGCRSLCESDNQCEGFTHNTDKNVCFLKNAIGTPQRFAGAVSGRRRVVASLPVSDTDFAVLPDRDLPGGDYRGGLQDASLRGIDLAACQRACAVDQRCTGFTYNERKQVCFLKDVQPRPEFFAGAVSGLKRQTDRDGLSWQGDDSPEAYVERIRRLAAPYGGDCDDDQAHHERLVRATSIAAPRGAVTAGAELALRWSAELADAPSYLMISAAQPVRFTGSGFYAVLPHAVAPFGIGVNKDQTRAIVALFGPSAERRGTVNIIPLIAGQLDLEWSLVTYQRKCGEELVHTTSLDPITVTTAPRPRFFVDDPFSLEAPEARILSPSGDHLVEIYGGRYRLLNTGTRSTIAERNGTDPQFSPTGRFLAALNDDGFDLVDTIDGEVVGRLGPGDVGWENQDSFVVVGSAGTAGWGAVQVTNTTNTGFAAGGLTSCRICSGRGIEFRIDLENDVLYGVGRLSGFGQRLTGKRAEFSFEPELRNLGERGAAPVVRPALDAFIKEQSGMAPIVHPEGWDFRGGQKFSHETEAYEPSDDETPADAGHRQLSGEVQISLPNGGPVLFDGPLAIRGASAIPRTLRRNDNQLARLKDLGLRFSPWQEPVLVASNADGEEGVKLAAQIEKSVPSVAGLFKPREYVSSCGHPPDERGRDLLVPEFTNAVRYNLEERTIWLTLFSCTEGTGLFFAGSFQLFDSRDRSGVFSINGDDPSSDAGTVCAGDVGFCSVTARLYDNRYLLIWSVQSRAVMLYDIDEKRVLFKKFDLGRGELLREAHLSVPDWLISQVNSDGSFFVYDIESGKQVLEGRFVDDETVAWTPDLTFDATPEGANYVKLKFPGQEGQFTFEQFKNKAKRPGLVDEVFSGRYRASPLSFQAPPALEAKLSPNGADRVRGSVRVASETGQVEIQVFQDGYRTDRIPLPDGASNMDVDVERLAGSRWVSLLAVDANGLTSTAVGQELPRGKQSLPAVHLVAVGIDSYADGDLSSLYYAKSDAERLASALSGLDGQYLNLKTSVSLVDPDATPDGILEAVSAAVAKSTEGDTIIFSFAGHGVTDDDGRFYLATGATRSDYIAGTALAWDKVGAALSRSKARVVVLLDACHSGVAGTRAFATNDDAAGEMLGSIPSNLLILSASKGRQFSEETPKAGGGVFTDAILDVLARDRSSHDRNENGAIEVSELYSGVKRRVMQATEGRQTPWLARNQMVGDFALF